MEISTVFEYTMMIIMRRLRRRKRRGRRKRRYKVLEGSYSTWL